MKHLKIIFRERCRPKYVIIWIRILKLTHQTPSPFKYWVESRNISILLFILIFAAKCFFADFCFYLLILFRLHFTVSVIMIWSVLESKMKSIFILSQICWMTDVYKKQVNKYLSVYFKWEQCTNEILRIFL